MGRSPRVALAIGGNGEDRDAFLAAALRRGARTAIWVDAAFGWAERYDRPAPSAGPGGAARYRRRELLWPGETLVVEARLAAPPLARLRGPGPARASRGAGG